MPCIQKILRVLYMLPAAKTVPDECIAGLTLSPLSIKRKMIYIIIIKKEIHTHMA